MEEKRPHLHIAVLTRGIVRWELSNFLHHMLLDTEIRDKLEFSVRYYPGYEISGRPVSSNRNRIVRDRPAGSDLIMLDEDVIPHSRMYEVALQDKDIVVFPTPIWRANEPNLCPVGINMNAAGPDKAITLGADSYDEVLQGGTGAIFISHRVLDHPQMRAPFMFLHDADGVTIRGEDYSFCDRATALGFKIFCASGLLCGHVHEVDMLAVMRRFYEMMIEVGVDDPA